MKALSVRQPIASLIVDGVKPIENRMWRTAYRGPVLIHAARQPHVMRVAEIEYVFRVKIEPELAFGCHIGVADLIDIVEASYSKWFSGPYGWVFENPQRITPIYMLGKQGLFDIDSSRLA